MSYAIPYKGITRFFNSEEQAIVFCKLAMIPANSVIKVTLS